MAKELPLRSEVDNEYKWVLEDIYPTDNDWEKDFEKVREMIGKLDVYRGNLVSSSNNLYEGIELIMEIREILERLYAYSHMRFDEDTSNQKYQALNLRAQTLATEIASATSFMVPEIITLSKEKVEEYLAENDKLKLYAHLLDDILREKDHYLSEREEKLLAMAGELAEGPENIYSVFSDAELVFPTIIDEEGNEVRVTHGRYIDFLTSKDRRVRKDAFTAMYGKHGEFINTFATTLNTQVKAHIFYARARNYNSALEAALSSDNIPVSVYTNLIDTVKENLDAMHKYVSLRKEVLELDELHMYDLYVPLVKELDLKIPYSQAKEKVLRGLKPLGEEYFKILEGGFNGGWIDVYENKGKRSGAYSSSCYGTHPYVLLNYTDNLDNMFTLAHEMGHALHTYYSDNNQPYVYSNYKIFLAEVASTLNEILLLHHLLENTDDILEKKYLINHYLEQFRGTVFRQTMFAEFEKIIHETAEAGQPLTADLLNEIYHRLNVEYYGPDIVVDEEIDLEWARIPHFYYNFYVYKYATGFSAATTLANKILEEGEPAVRRYLEFLKSGNADYPLNILEKAGVDMSSPDPIKTAIDSFRDFLNRFEELL